jgi:hypothetical protein
MGETNNWTRVFQLNYIVGAPVSFLLYIAFCYGVSKPRGLGIQRDMQEHIPVVDGVPENSGEGSMEGSEQDKGARMMDVKTIPERV